MRNIVTNYMLRLQKRVKKKKQGEKFPKELVCFSFTIIRLYSIISLSSNNTLSISDLDLLILESWMRQGERLFLVSEICHNLIMKRYKFSLNFLKKFFTDKMCFLIYSATDICVFRLC